MPRKSDEEFIINLKHGQEVESYFAISGIEVRMSPTIGKFLHFVLSDKTMEVPVTYWSGAKTDEKREILGGTKTVKMRGVFQEFPPDSGKYNILINPNARGYIEPYQVTEHELSDLTRVSPKDLDVLMNRILKTISELKNPHLKRILESFFEDTSFREEFYKCPSAKIHHHNYVGGLLEHTVDVLSICKCTCEMYPELDRDLLLAGAILHDIGKLKSYKYDQLTIELTEDVKLLGHLVLSENMIRDKIKELGDIPEDLSRKLLHLVLSHHGEVKKGWGSPVRPQIPEAFALHQADNLDAKVKKSVEKASLT